MPKLRKKEAEKAQSKKKGYGHEASTGKLGKTLKSQKNGKSTSESEKKHSKKQLSCPYCREKFTSKTSYKRHTSTAHAKSVSDQKTTSTVSQTSDAVVVKRPRGRPRKIRPENETSNKDKQEKVKRSPSDSESKDDGLKYSSSDGSKPVTCSTCRNTYRSVVGYRNHLPTCIPYSSTSSEESDGDETADPEDSNNSRPEYEEDVICSDDEFLQLSKEDDSCRQTDIVSPPAGHLQKNKTSDSIYSEETISLKTSSPTCSYVPPATSSPSVFNHAFSISSLVAKKDPPARPSDPAPFKSVNPLVASVERFFSTPAPVKVTEKSKSYTSTSTEVQTVASVSSRDRTENSFLTPHHVSKSTQMTPPQPQEVLRSTKVSKSAVPSHKSVSVNTCSPPKVPSKNLDRAQKISSQNSKNGLFSPARTLTQSSQVKPVAKTVPPADKVSPSIAKQVPITILSPPKPTTSTSYPPCVIPRQDRNNVSTSYSVSDIYGSTRTSHYPTISSFPSPGSTLVGRTPTPTETITLQDSNGQVMRVEMPTVPSISHQASHIIPPMVNSQQVLSYQWPYQSLEQQQLLNAGYPPMGSSQSLYQPSLALQGQSQHLLLQQQQLAFQQQQLAALNQHQSGFNSLISQQLQFPPQQYHTNIATILPTQPTIIPHAQPFLGSPQMLHLQGTSPYLHHGSNAAVIPWLGTTSGSNTAASHIPSISNNAVGQEIPRNDGFLVLQQSRAFPSQAPATVAPPAAVHPPQFTVESYKSSSLLTSPQRAMTGSFLAENSLLTAPAAVTSANNNKTAVVTSNTSSHKVHAHRGSGTAHPCSCSLCSRKLKNEITTELKLISKNKMHQQFISPTWSSLASTRRNMDLTTKPESFGSGNIPNGFNTILPVTSSQSSTITTSAPVEGLAGALVATPFAGSELKKPQMGRPFPFSVGSFISPKPVENPLQRLSDQISQLGKSGIVDQSISGQVQMPNSQPPTSTDTHGNPSISFSKSKSESDKLTDLNNKFQSAGLPKVGGSCSRKRQLENTDEQQPKPKRKYCKRAIEQDQSERSVRVTFKKKEGESVFSIKSIRQTGCENRGSMKSLKIKAKVMTGEKAAITSEIVVIPNVHLIPLPAGENGHRTVREDEEENSKALGEAKPAIEEVKDSGISTPSIMTHRAVILYEVKFREGIQFRSSDVRSIWSHIFEIVHGTRGNRIQPPLSFPSLDMFLPGGKPHPNFDTSGLGLVNGAIDFLLKELPNKGPKVKDGTKEKKVSSKKVRMMSAESPEASPSGCARLEGFLERKRFDMFGWLASKHRNLPGIESVDVGKSEMPITLAHMRYKTLKGKSPKLLGVFYSTIHGRGLFTRRDIQEGEMVIEYAGEVIRPILCDYRERLYESKGYGCYMFKIDEFEVVDATMRGNAARFINHSCDPNCKSKVVEIMGKQRILIFALRKILGGEELTYDYHFSKEHKDKKIPCTCGATRCRKFLN